MSRSTPATQPIFVVPCGFIRTLVYLVLIHFGSYTLTLGSPGGNVRLRQHRGSTQISCGGGYNGQKSGPYGASGVPALIVCSALPNPRFSADLGVDKDRLSTLCGLSSQSSRKSQVVPLSMRQSPTSRKSAARSDSLRRPPLLGLLITPSLPPTNYHSLLRSRTVKLVVGPNRTTFNAPAATLCSLPFFHAAINGEFKEAAQCAISMPEDDVAAISALIEFLATGTYSYAFYTDPEAAKSMPRRADEALFHVGVYVVADKYDSQGLVTAAKRNFREVVKDIRGPDILRVWAVAYGAGMRVQGNWGANDVGEVDEGVVKQIKGMLDSDDKEPDRAVREIPDFGVDLLKIAVRMALKD